MTGNFLRPNHVLPQTNGTDSQILSCLCPALLYMRGVFILVLRRKDYKLFQVKEIPKARRPLSKKQTNNLFIRQKNDKFAH